MTRVAGIDCGTNSLRLLVRDLAAPPTPGSELVRRNEIVRLGQDVDRTGRLADDALERTRKVLVDYAAVCRELGVARLRMVATSATRDAANRDTFVALVHDTLGVEPDVVTGDEEARLSFTGATLGLPPDLASPLLVVDLGGGSTEVVLGTAEGGPTAAHSMDVGCVRLTERRLHGDPVTPDEIATLRADVAAALDAAERDVPLREARSMIGLAGTVVTLAALSLGLSVYDPLRVHHSRLSVGQVSALAAQLAGSTHAERAASPVIHPGRVDVIAAGALVLEQVMLRAGVPELLASEADILDGIALSAAGAEFAWS
ncbi:MAG: Ppx/GppA phosphatase [Mycobacterium sp.]|nr:Ppx/GppA phosphatase [Mycobacterium sp.]